MKVFCVVTNSYRDIELNTAKKVCQYLINHGAICTIIDNVDEKTGEFKVLKNQDMPLNLECVISIGGDGTLLHASKDLLEMDTVFVGVNKGTLGFLAEISPEKLYEALDRLLSGEFNVESRMMLKGEIIRDGECLYTSTVLNDIVVHRGADLAISEYDVYVNNQMLGSYHADGLIFATPTGSTAYNLSAGGPVARPDSHMIMLTPICPHTLANRSILLSSNDSIDVKVGKCRTCNDEKRIVAFDGDGIFKVLSGDVIRISKAMSTTKIVKLDEGSFLQTIKDKLN